MAEQMVPAIPGIPQWNGTVIVQQSEWATIEAKALKTYIEFPRFLPPSSAVDVNLRQTPLAVSQSLWERAAVSTPTGLGASLPPLALLHPHKYVDFVQLPREWLPSSDLVLARLAGFDKASFGLPANGTWPLLARSSARVLTAATQLSHCRRRRFAPSERWQSVVSHILSFTSSGVWKASKAGALWRASVTASFSRVEALPADAELHALRRGVDFLRTSRLLPTATRAAQLAQIGTLSDAPPDYLQTQARRAYARNAPPYYTPSSGDGQLGIFEGFTSDIAFDGSQPQANGMRCDCVTETSASFAARALVLGNASDAAVARNLLNYGHLHAGFHQPWAVGANAGGGTADGRPWVIGGDAFGLKAWTTAPTAFELFYKDDDARGFLGAIATAGLLQSERWHSTLASGVLANLRLTPRDGYGPSELSFDDLVDAQSFDPAKGWRRYYDSAHHGSSEYISPHYQSYVWAAFLWAHRASGYAPLLERAQAALTRAMHNYPTAWVPTSNGIAVQRARILLPLAFLVRANDTAEHRRWLIRAVDGLLGRRHCEADWCAYKEELSARGWGGTTRVPTNDDYGTFEAPLNQENEDPVSDLLYTSNFALLGLHEAAAALSNATIRAEEDKLVKYLVRAQARSAEHAEMDGAFYRAFDYEKWEVWASDADIGWGAWSVETGWTQSWITTVLGMRQLNTSLWDLGSSPVFDSIRADFEAWIPIMFP